MTTQLQRAVVEISKAHQNVPEIDFTQHQLDDGTNVSTQERLIKEVCFRMLSLVLLCISDARCCAAKVQAPAMFLPTNAQFFSRENPTKPNIAFLKNHFYREGRVTEEQALYILEKGTELLRAEPNLLQVDAPVTGMSSSTSTLVIGEYCLSFADFSCSQCAETFMVNM